MELFICQFCGDERKSRKSLIGHETFCKSNPNHKERDTTYARRVAMEKTECEWCGKDFTKAKISKHKKACLSNPKVIKDKSKNCPVCGTNFISKSVTCSYSCSNKYFRHSNEGGLRYNTDEQLIEKSRYRDLCFRYHEKKCVVCGEMNIVEVHHYDENNGNNSPENLIPLCPTHHQYYHSRYKNLVENTIDKYLKEWYTNNCSVGE